MLSIENLRVRVGKFELQGITFSVERGDYFVILGASGVGKSLLLETIAGLWQPEAGSIRLRGQDITVGSVQKRNVSIVYQDAGLFPHLSVYENIAYPLRSRRQRPVAGKVAEAAANTGIADKLDRKPDTLSGGEYQRVALARSLAAGADLLLLDEPLASLDAKSKHELRSLLRKLNRGGLTVIHVTHDYEEAISLANRIGVMENGELVHVAPPQEIFRRPKSEFVAHLIGVKNYLKGSVQSVPGSDLKEFVSGGIRVFCLTDVDDGEAHLVIRPDEITIANVRETNSSRNRFAGRIADIAPAKIGVEVCVDVGVEMVATISSDAARALQLEIGREVWISFKAASCKVYG
jgi:molybdopterin-binding protein